METQQPMRIFCKTNTNLNAAVRGDKVILVRADSSDKSQHWFQDYSAIGKLTDEEGGRAFALVNRTTGQAMAVNTEWEGAVQLAPYSGHVAVELSKLWSLDKPRDDGFSNVRVLKRIYYKLDAFAGGPVTRDGAIVSTYEPHAYYNHALWKIIPINEQ